MGGTGGVNVSDTSSSSFSSSPASSHENHFAGCDAWWVLLTRTAARFVQRCRKCIAGDGRPSVSDSGVDGTGKRTMQSPVNGRESRDEEKVPSLNEARKSLGLPVWPRHRFEFQRVLGRGSFGTVMLATDTMDQMDTNSSRRNSTYSGFSSFRNSFPRRRSNSLVRQPSKFTVGVEQDDDTALSDAEGRMSRRSLSLSSLSSASSSHSGSSLSRASSSEQTEQQQQYAVKRISKARLSKRALNEIKKEIDIHRSLGKSINVIYIYGAYEDENYVYIVLELCTGGVLYKRIKLGNYSEATAAEYTRSMLRVLAQCHSRGVIHRDLKPDNFLFLNNEPDSPLKATDFGLAVYFTPGTFCHDVTGTPFYMAPEVVLGKYSKEVDLWSLGVVVFQLLTGQLPFNHDPKVRGREASIQVLRRVLHQEFNIMSSPLMANISASAKDLVSRLLVRDPSLRLTVEEALSHPWVRADGDAPTLSLSNSVVQRLQHFGTYGWLKQRALLSMVSIMHRPEDGHLNDDDAGSTASVTQSDDLSSSPGTDGRRKSVTWVDEEVDSLTEDLQDTLYLQAEEISSMFVKFDADDNGRLDFFEMKNALRNMDFRLSESEIEQLFIEMDIDRSGTIEYEEFTATLFNWAVLSKTKHWTGLVRRVFNEIDTDGDGKISVTELTSMFQDSTGEDDADFATAVAEEMLQKVDLNDDGEIDFNEFLELLEASSVECDFSMYATARSFNKLMSSKTLDFIRRKD